MVKKIVRDKIPEIIKANWREPIFYVAWKQEYEKELFKKLLEETKEVIEERGNTEKLKEELWDVLEVFYSILKEKNISFEEIEEIRKNKKLKNWWFQEGIILELK